MPKVSPYVMDFDRSYLKIDSGTSHAILVNASQVSLKDLPEAFLLYDRAHEDGTVFNFKHKEYILLLFLAGRKLGCNYLFTTLRSYTPKKWDFYKNAEGEAFEIVEGRKTP